MPGRRPQPTAIRRRKGNPGKRAWNRNEPVPPSGMPTCPEHLCEAAATEWARVAPALHEAGVLSVVDRAALAAYCQAYGRWVEAEEALRAGPAMVATPSGGVKPSPWIVIAKRQTELMRRFVGELGLTPTARGRVAEMPIDIGGGRCGGM